LKLGRDWTPKVVRNNINTNITYTKPDKFPLLNKIIIFFLIKKITHFNYNFKKSMSFLNKERWEVLKKEEYLVAWFEVLLDIFEIAQKNNIMIFMINPPSLVDVHDSKINRGIYISNSRLDRWFANYQAISGARISNFLSVIDKFGSIPVMNCKSSFEKFQGLDRLRLFTDEIHLSAAGNKVLANDVFSFLKHNKVFNKFYKEGCNKQKIDFNKLLCLKNKAVQNSKEINNNIDKIISSVGDGSIDHEESIPTDRYTTF